MNNEMTFNEPIPGPEPHDISVVSHENFIIGQILGGFNSPVYLSSPRYLLLL